MPSYSANLSMLYTHLPFTDRFAAAAADGFAAVEYLGPYTERRDTIAGLLEKNGLTQALFNVPSGDWEGGERGIACMPDRTSEFRQGVEQAIEYATALDCIRLNVLAGVIPQDTDPAGLEDTFVANLAFAAEKCADAGVTLMFEPINRRDIPGFFVGTTDHAERVLDRVGHDNLFVQYDFYHMQIMQGDLAHTFERLQDRIGHVQIADNPGRHEPGTGEINYRFILSELDRLGYHGWVGCEYKPAGDTSAGLSWMQTHTQTAQEPVATAPITKS